MKEKARLEEILNDQGKRVEVWLENAEKAFEFACHAREWFNNGSSEEKTLILQTLGSNLTLKDREFNIKLKNPSVGLFVFQTDAQGLNRVSNLKIMAIIKAP